MSKPKLVELRPQFIIENDVPVPEVSRGARKYPFHKMEIGQSFTTLETPGGSVRAAACSHGKRHSKLFTTRKEGKMVRVWRIK